MTLIDQVLEYLYNPQWLTYFMAIMGVTVALLVIIGSRLSANSRSGVPLAIRDQQQLLGKMAWLRGSCNFYLVVALFALLYPKVFHLQHPDFYVVFNLAVAIAISVAAVQYLRARTLMRKLTSSS